MAKIEGAIGHRFQSLSVDSFCLRGNMKLASLILDSSSRSRYILSSPGVGSSTLIFKCTVFNNGGRKIGKHCCGNIRPWETMLSGLHTFGKHG